MMRTWLKKLQEAAELENRKVILSLLEPNESASILDLGCGDGDFTLELGEEIGTKELHGIEIAEEFRGQPEKRGIKVHIADLNEVLPLDSESLDVVHANQVIEHIYKTDVCLREVYRVLRHGGYAIISTPNLAALYIIFSLVFGWQPTASAVSDEMPHLGNPLNPSRKVRRERNYPAHAHLRIFTSAALKELLQYHGFKVEKIVSVGYYPFAGKVGRFFSRLDPRHSVYLTVKARKV